MNQSAKTFESFDISEQAKEINQRLSAKICSEMDLYYGKMPFSKFMQMALYEPGLGYYQNNLHKFGKKGDFVTAPEMGKNFAHCVANSMSQFFIEASLNNPDELSVLLEIGAGSGVLALNLISQLMVLNALPHQYYILEPSASLQDLQRQLLREHLPDYFPNVQWVTQLPENMKGIIIANEVIDAIPCERIRKVNGQWIQLGVSCDDRLLNEDECNDDNHFDEDQLINSQFHECEIQSVNTQQLPPSLSHFDDSEAYPEGYTTEYRELVNPWIKSLSNCLSQGAIILLDYGYCESELYHPQRIRGSLSCFINHHNHSNPFQFLGLQDITAHVDFTQIARAADKNSLDVDGYTTQAGFLLENGIVEMTEAQSANETQEQRYLRSQELQKLLMPGQMGEVFKVILLSKNLETEIKGFTLQDHRHRL